MPEIVVALDAHDDFLKERVMNLSEEVVQVRIAARALPRAGNARAILTKWRLSQDFRDRRVLIFFTLFKHLKKFDLPVSLSSWWKLISFRGPPDKGFARVQMFFLWFQNTHNTEEGFLRRLQEYRSINHEDDTVLNYFDELEIHPEHIGNCVETVMGLLLFPVFCTTQLALHCLANLQSFTSSIWNEWSTKINLQDRSI